MNRSLFFGLRDGDALWRIQTDVVLDASPDFAQVSMVDIDIRLGVRVILQILGSQDREVVLHKGQDIFLSQVVSDGQSVLDFLFGV